MKQEQHPFLKSEHKRLEDFNQSEHSNMNNIRFHSQLPAAEALIKKQLNI